MKKTPKQQIKVEINLVSGTLTTEAAEAWNQFWQETFQITNRNLAKFEPDRTNGK